MRRDELISLAAALAAPYRIRPPEQLGGGPAGMFGGRGDGQSVDFHDFRQYLPGDDLRRVDWRAYARTGQMHLKLFREEVSPVVELFLDASASMAAYPGKVQAAIFLAAFLRNATLAAEGRPVLCRNGRRFVGGDFEPALAGTEFSGSGEAEPPVTPGARPLRFHLSDYLFGEGIATLFRRHAAGSLLFSPVMILSRSERDPAWRGHHRLYDVEQPDAFVDLALDAAMVRAYRERLRKHEETLAGEALRHGGRLLLLDVPDGDLSRSDCEALTRRLASERVVTTR